MTVDKSGKRVRSMFAQIAKRYDFLNHFLSCGIDVYWRNRTAKSIDPSLGGPVLDVCSGTGDLAIAIRRQVDPKRVVVSTDFTHEMLVIAKRKIDQKHPRQIEVLESDAQALPFEDNAFSAVTVAFGLRNISDTRRGLREMVRVCEPGGQVIVLEFSQPTLPVIGGIYRWYFRQVLPRIGQLLARNRESAYSYLPESVSEFPSGRALTDVMTECGLEQTSYHPMTIGISTLYIGRKPPVRVDDVGVEGDAVLQRVAT